MDFTTIDYLKFGSQTQQEIYHLLVKNGIFENLKDFSPILVGTFPIGIAIESSDLDIACYWREKNQFIAHLKNCFEDFENFHLQEQEVDTKPTIIAGFKLEGFEFEIFGQDIPVTAQFGYRHMIIEAKILEEKGDSFRQEIIELKKQGLKTEPAFAKLLGITGNPYLELLKLENN